VDDPLILVRAVHFAATLTASGAAFFKVFTRNPHFGLPLMQSCEPRSAGAWHGLRGSAWC
jgi:hypothetical protein